METQTLERNNIHSNPNPVISGSHCNPTSKCKFCGNYKLQRGSMGHCQLLNAPVRGGWKSCALAIPAFAPSWEQVEKGNISPRGIY